MAIELGDNIQTGAPKPTDSRYLNNQVPWTGVTEVNANIAGGIGGVRYTGLTVNILGTEYWYKNGIGDGDLIPKELGASGSVNMSGSTVGGLTTYVDANTICAQSGATYDGTTLGIKSQSVSSDSLCIINSADTDMLLRVRENAAGNSQFNLYDSAGVSQIQFISSGTSSICGGNLNLDTGYTLTAGSIVSDGPNNYGNFTSKKNSNLGGNAYYDGQWKSFGDAATYGNAVLFSTAGHVCTNPYALEAYVDTTVTAANQVLSWTNIFNVGLDGTVYTPKVCATTCLRAPAITLTTGAASGCVLTSDGSGNATWATPTGGGGVAVSGTTDNGIITYINSTGNICAEPNLTWDTTSRILCVVPGDCNARESGVARLGLANFRQGYACEEDYLYTGSIVLGGNSQLGTYAMGMAHKSWRDDTTGCFTYTHAMVTSLGALRTKYNHSTVDTTAAAGGTWRCIPYYVAATAVNNRVLTAVDTNSMQGEANLTFNGSALAVTGGITTTSQISTTSYSAASGRAVLINKGTWYASLDCVGSQVRMLGMEGSSDVMSFGPIENTNASLCIYLGGGYKHEFCANGTIDLGGTVNVSGNVVLDSTSRCLKMQDRTSSGIGTAFCMVGGNACTTTSSTYTGGYVQICGGRGSNYSGSWNNGGTGGYAMICGGAGGSTDNAGSTGGAVYIRGGCGATGPYSAYGRGGAVYICGGSAGSATCQGDIYMSAGDIIDMCTNGTRALYVSTTTTCLYYNGSAKLYTVTNGICLGTQCGFGVDWVATSDCRLKDCVVPISNALSMVTQLCGVCHELCGDENHETRVGLIAQDVEKVLPAVVTRNKPSEEDIKYGICDKVLGIKYDKLTAVLIEAVKEQQIQIEELKERLNTLGNNG